MSRMLLIVCSLVLSLALTFAPALAQDAGAAPDTTPYSCRPLAFFLQSRQLAFSSVSGDDSYVVLQQQPVVTAHNIVIVFGMDARGGAVNDSSVLLHPLEFKSGSDAGTRVAEPRRGRYMSASNPADANIFPWLAAAYPTAAPMRFDISVPWNFNSRRYEFIFRHLQCGEQRVVYKYNPRGALEPIFPDDVPVGQLNPNVTVDPTPTPVVPPTSGSQVEHCQLTAVVPANQWACTPAFARDVYDYKCTSAAGAFLERVTVQAASNHLAMKLTAEADVSDESVVLGLVTGVESSSFPLLTGGNIIELSTAWNGICNVTYVFEVQRAEAPANEPPAANWRADEFGACTGTCPNQGSQTRTVTCVTESGEAADESLCGGAATKPLSSQSCFLSCGPAEGDNTDGGNNNNNGGNGFADSTAHSSAVASPLALLGAAFVALLALRQ